MEIFQELQARETPQDKIGRPLPASAWPARLPGQRHNRGSVPALLFRYFLQQRPCLKKKKKRWRVMEEPMSIFGVWPPYACTPTYMFIYTQAWTYISHTHTRYYLSRMPLWRRTCCVVFAWGGLILAPPLFPSFPSMRMIAMYRHHVTSALLKSQRPAQVLAI